MTLDSIASSKLLKDGGKISSDVILMFNELYLQKCKEFREGETIGADETGDFYKGLICFMIVGLKSNIPFVVRAVPGYKKSQVRGFKKRLTQLYIFFRSANSTSGGLCATIIQQMCQSTKSYLLALALKTKISSL